MEVICLELNAGMSKRVLVKQGPIRPLQNESIIVCQTALQTGKLIFSFQTTTQRAHDRMRNTFVSPITDQIGNLSSLPLPV